MAYTWVQADGAGANRHSFLAVTVATGNPRAGSSPVGAGAPFSWKLVSASPPREQNHSSRSTQCDLRVNSTILVASLRGLGIGDIPPLAGCIGFVLVLSTCSARVTVTVCAPLAAMCTLFGALGHIGSAGAMSRQVYRARGWLHVRCSY